MTYNALLIPIKGNINVALVLSVPGKLSIITITSVPFKNWHRVRCTGVSETVFGIFELPPFFLGKLVKNCLFQQKSYFMGIGARFGERFEQSLTCRSTLQERNGVAIFHRSSSLQYWNATECFGDTIIPAIGLQRTVGSMWLSARKGPEAMLG